MFFHQIPHARRSISTADVAEVGYIGGRERDGHGDQPLPFSGWSPIEIFSPFHISSPLRPDRLRYLRLCFSVNPSRSVVLSPFADPGTKLSHPVPHHEEVATRETSVR